MYALNAEVTPFRARPVAVARPAAEAVSFATLFQGQPLESFSPGAAVFWEGDSADDLFELSRGILRLYRILQDGRRAIIGFVFPGDLLGLSFKSEYLFTAEAVTDVVIKRFPRRRFNALMNESPEFRPQLVARLCDEMCAAQDQMLTLLHRSAEARVASFFLMVARRTVGKIAKATQFELPMSRTDIADYLGLTIETVCRSIGKLKSDGLIVLRGPHKVVVEKPKALRQLAGEDADDDLTAAPAATATSREARPAYA